MVVDVAVVLPDVFVDQLELAGMESVESLLERQDGLAEVEDLALELVDALDRIVLLGAEDLEPTSRMSFSMPVTTGP